MNLPKLVRIQLRGWAAMLLALTLWHAAVAQDIEADAAALHWVGTWSAPPQQPWFNGAPLATGFFRQTLREIVHVSIGGSRLRVRFTNAYGSAPLQIGAARVALRSNGVATVPGSDRALSFGGKSAVSIAPGALVLSDPVNLDLPPRSDLAVSIFFPGATGRPTLHFRSRQTNYVSPPGNFAAGASMPVASTSVCADQFANRVCTSPWYFLAGVEVRAPAGVAAVVALGDSITAGAGTVTDANRRWPDVLARRLLHQGPTMGVLNQGLDGNTLWTSALGESALARFDRDVLAVAGAKFVIVLLGINDLRAGASAARVIAGLQQLAVRAQAAGLKAYGGTLTPFLRASDAQEAQRQAVNRWIRTSGAFDAVIDFDAVLRDPTQPRRMRPIYDSGDTLHPNAAGYEAMAGAIDLSLFRP
jgi:lysophospholipase L1-like esterase